MQRYSLHDGPGIRSIVFLKGCPLRCQWCSNPESQSFGQELFYNQIDCIGCGSCTAACHTGALTVSDYSSNLGYDAVKCRHCFACTSVCTTQALSVSGRRMGVDELMIELEKDRCFFIESGGGVTLSGGEPLAQVDFTVALLKAIKERGINTCIETCAFVPREAFEQVLPYTDFVYCDIKHSDNGRHREYTGVDTTIAFNNLGFLLSKDCDVTVRIPVIPGFNNDMDSMRGIAAKLSSIGVREVNLLPFHQFGEAKYNSLFRQYAMQGTKPLQDSDIEIYKRMFTAYGMQVRVGG